MADHRAAADTPSLQSHIDTATVTPTESGPEDARNGTNYLLTSLTLFTTHEPCIMCSMALIHSRVKEVVYLYPMAKTGGCGGVACLPTLKGVNHRFGICHWILPDDVRVGSLGVDPAIDA
jgi:tRNA-specific adenosine deaminase 3